MALYAIAGECYFTTQNRRNQAANAITNAAGNRGFDDTVPFAHYEAGMTLLPQNANGWGFRCCFTSEDKVAIDAAERDASTALASGNYEGSFGTYLVIG